jgi:spore germination protein GerM
METGKTSGKPYKKMNTSPDRRERRAPTPSSRRDAPHRTKTNGKTIPTSALKEEAASSLPIRIGRILTLLLMLIIIAGLCVLIFLFFRPGRIQIWQPGSGSSPVIERLEPEEPVVALREEELPEQKPAERTEEGQEEQSPQMRDMKIYFVKVNTEGQISLKSTVRSIDFSSSPLTNSVNSLIRGPGSDEINKGSLTLIPDGSRLLSARVESGTAYLNFNEAFRFNPLGREGYLAQLKQVIYTTTEFSNIKDVQILIEGVVRDYLGGEGFYIGAPLNRESFQSGP